MNANDPAFPLVSELRDAEGKSLPGLSKREYIATKLLQGILANPQTTTSPIAQNMSPDRFCCYVAQLATVHADELLKELAKE